MKRASDPLVSSVVVLIALGVAGLLVVALAWRGVAADVDVADQVPFLVSGGIGGLALVGFGFGLLVIQHRRFLEARRRADFGEVVAAAAELVAHVRHDDEGADR